jgi:hypothetical protein
MLSVETHQLRLRIEFFINVSYCYQYILSVYNVEKCTGKIIHMIVRIRIEFSFCVGQLNSFFPHPY